MKSYYISEFDRVREAENAKYEGKSEVGNSFHPTFEDVANQELARAEAKLRQKRARLRWQARDDPGLQHELAPGKPKMFVEGYDVYKSDVRIRWRNVWKDPAGGGGERGAITERTVQSRKRLAFTIGNSETKIIGMIVLTWRVAPLDGLMVKRQLGDFFDAVRRKWGKRIEWLWFLEFQKRGAPHIHILTCGSIHDDWQTIKVTRSKRGKITVRPIFVGPEVDWIGRKWLSIIGDDFDAARRFTAGGIWEKFETPDGAARYASKDAWKPYQTQVPMAYQNVGAWWHHSRGFASPTIRETVMCGEVEARAALKIQAGEKLFPVLFGRSKDIL